MRVRRAIFRVFAITAFIVVGGCIEFYDDVSSAIEKSRRRLRVGILADAHLAPPHSDAMFLKALTYFSVRDVDAVVLLGDITENGNLVQRRSVRKLFDKAFPNGRRADGGETRLLVVTGEKDDTGVYEAITGHTNETVFATSIRGYDFIGANWRDSTSVDAWALKPLLAKVNKDRPFFYLQALVPYDTCCALDERLDNFEGGKVAYMLSKYPNAVALCARAHAPLTDESAFWRGAFTCVHAGTFSFARGRSTADTEFPRIHQGLLMSVYDDSIVFERLDFNGKPVVEKVGPDWVVPLPATSSLAAQSAVPQFWDDMRLTLFPSSREVRVVFPPVLAKHTGVRAYDYEVRVEPSGIVRRVYSQEHCASEEHENKPVVCTFLRKELPRGRVRFIVTPINAFGKRGCSISEEVAL